MTIYLTNSRTVPSFITDNHHDIVLWHHGGQDGHAHCGCACRLRVGIDCVFKSNDQLWRSKREREEREEKFVSEELQGC